MMPFSTSFLMELETWELSMSSFLAIFAWDISTFFPWTFASSISNTLRSSHFNSLFDAIFSNQSLYILTFTLHPDVLYLQFHVLIFLHIYGIFLKINSPQFPWVLGLTLLLFNYPMLPHDKTVGYLQLPHGGAWGSNYVLQYSRWSLKKI